MPYIDRIDINDSTYDINDIRLQGGDKGQVLTKNSNADGDFKWKVPSGMVGSAEWGQIDGNIDNQKDLKGVLDSKYEKPESGIPYLDFDADTRNIIEKADNAYTKPSTGIPAEDIAPGVIPVIPNDLLKYTSQSLSDDQKGQARANIGALSAEDIASLTAEEYVEVSVLPTASESTVGKIYLVGPDGNGEYDRYITSVSGATFNWVQIGGTSIDLSDYATHNSVKESTIKQLYGSSLNASRVSDRYALLDTGKFGTNNTYYHATISVNEGDIFLITNNAAVGGISYTRYAFTTSGAFESGGDIPVVSGTSVMTTAAGKTDLVIIPAGCNYLLVNYRNADDSTYPYDVRKVLLNRVAELNPNDVYAHRFTEMEPERVIENKMINNYCSLDDGNNFDIRVYTITPGNSYAFSGKFGAGYNPRFIAWADSENNIIAYSNYQGSTSSAVTYEKQMIKAPGGAAYAMLNVQKVNDNTYHFYSVANVLAQEIYSNALTSDDVVDSLDSDSADKPLSARQGKILSQSASGVSAKDYENMPIKNISENTGYHNGQEMSSQYFNLIKYSVTPNTTYYLNCFMRKALDFYFLYWLDEDDNYISRESIRGNLSSSAYYCLEPVTAPATAAYALLNCDVNYVDFNALMRQRPISFQEEFDNRIASDALCGIADNKITILPYVAAASGTFSDGALGNKCAAIAVKPGERYEIRLADNARTTFTFNYAFATSNECELGELVPIVPGTEITRFYAGSTIVTIPEGCSYLLVNYNNYYGDGMYRLNVRKLQNDTSKADRRILRLLSIGNSYSEDALAYVPYIMDNMGVDVDLQIGILMMSSSNISDHVNNFNNETAAYTFEIYTPGAASWVSLGSKTIQYALENYEWDIIMTHQLSTSAHYMSTYQPYINQLVNLIYTKLTYPVRFAWMISQTRPAKTNSGANRSDATINEYTGYTLQNANTIIDETLFDVIIPVGAAIANARTIESLKLMGAYKDNANNTSGYGYLTPNDGVHLQEGLPCQIAAYTVILTLLDLLGMSQYSVYGDITRVTSEWASGKNIPHPHGAYIGSTDENCKMAQMCAIMAHKHPYEVTDMNYIINPT